MLLTALIRLASQHLQACIHHDAAATKGLLGPNTSADLLENVDNHLLRNSLHNRLASTKNFVSV